MDVFSNHNKKGDYDGVSNTKNKTIDNESLQVVAYNWIRKAVGLIFTSGIDEKIKNDTLAKALDVDLNTIIQNFELIIMHTVQQSEENPNTPLCTQLTPKNGSYNVHLNLMYVPNLSKMVSGKYASRTSSGLVWGLIGEDLINSYSIHPVIRDTEGNKIKPIFRSHREIWYPFQEYKFIMMKIATELTILNEYINSSDGITDLFKIKDVMNNKIERQLEKQARGKVSIIEAGLLGTDVEPDLSFVKDYDERFQTVLGDIIKLNPKKDLRPYKTVIQQDGETYSHYRFNQHGTPPDTLIRALERVSSQVPLLFCQRIRWSMKLPFPKARACFKNALTQFWNSKCIIAILSFSRHTRLLIKSQNYASMYVVDPWKSFSKYESNMFYTQIIKTAKSCGVKIIFLERDVKDQARGEGSCSLASLARALYLCMSLRIEYENELSKGDDDPVDIVDEDVLFRLLNEPLNDSVVSITTSIMRKKKSVWFDPKFIKD